MESYSLPRVRVRVGHDGRGHLNRDNRPYLSASLAPKFDSGVHQRRRSKDLQLLEPFGVRRAANADAGR
jgi:hypothetical protein